MIKTLLSNADGAGSIPGWGTKIPHATQHGKKKKKEREGEKMSFKYIWIHKRQLNVWVLARKTVKGIRKSENSF